MGANFAQNNPTTAALLKGGMTGLSQGLNQYGSQNPQFDFSKLQQGFQQARKPALGKGITPGAANPTGAFSQGFSQQYIPPDQRYT